MDTFRPLAADSLPVFRLERDAYSIFYAPGYLAVAPAARATAFAADIAQPSGARPAAELQRRARAARAEQPGRSAAPFRPVSLMLYLNNECSLRCTYCYSEPSAAPAAQLSLAAVRAAAEVVAENCRARGLPFVLVFHGGGEPTRHPRLLREALEMVEALAGARGVPLFRYVATNGAAPPELAGWLGRRFDQVGLSCDGPPDIHDRQRPDRNGRGTSAYVERTAAILHEQGASLHVRATITPETVHRQPEIAGYLCRAIRPAAINVEPVYRAGRAAGGTGFRPDHADAFVAAFLEAEAVAGSHGVTWTNSGSRPWELHGPFCNVLRDVVNLVPDGVATACFLSAGAGEVERRGVGIGRLEGERFILNEDGIRSLQTRLRVRPDACAQCFNQFHCARTCPDACVLDRDASSGGFLCLVRQKLAQAHLEARAAALWAGPARRSRISGAPIVA